MRAEQIWAASVAPQLYPQQQQESGSISYNQTMMRQSSYNGMIMDTSSGIQQIPNGYSYYLPKLDSTGIIITTGPDQLSTDSLSGLQQHTQQSDPLLQQQFWITNPPPSTDIIASSPVLSFEENYRGTWPQVLPSNDPNSLPSPQPQFCSINDSMSFPHVQSNLDPIQCTLQNSPSLYWPPCPPVQLIPSDVPFLPHLSQLDQCNNDISGNIVRCNNTPSSSVLPELSPSIHDQQEQQQNQSMDHVGVKRTLPYNEDRHHVGKHPRRSPTRQQMVIDAWESSSSSSSNVVALDDDQEHGDHSFSDRSNTDLPSDIEASEIGTSTLLSSLSTQKHETTLVTDEAQDRVKQWRKRRSRNESDMTIENGDQGCGRSGHNETDVTSETTSIADQVAEMKSTIESSVFKNIHTGGKLGLVDKPEERQNLSSLRKTFRFLSNSIDGYKSFARSELFDVSFIMSTKICTCIGTHAYTNTYYIMPFCFKSPPLSDL